MTVQTTFPRVFTLIADAVAGGAAASVPRTIFQIAPGDAQPVAIEEILITSDQNVEVNLCQVRLAAQVPTVAPAAAIIVTYTGAAATATVQVTATNYVGVTAGAVDDFNIVRDPTQSVTVAANAINAIANWTATVVPAFAVQSSNGLNLSAALDAKGPVEATLLCGAVFTAPSDAPIYLNPGAANFNGTVNVLATAEPGVPATPVVRHLVLIRIGVTAYIRFIPGSMFVFPGEVFGLILTDDSGAITYTVKMVLSHT